MDLKPLNLNIDSPGVDLTRYPSERGLLAGSPLISRPTSPSGPAYRGLSGLSIAIDRNFSAAQEPNPSLTDGRMQISLYPPWEFCSGTLWIFFLFAQPRPPAHAPSPFSPAASCTPTSPLLLFLLLSLRQRNITLLQISTDCRHFCNLECRIRFHLK